MSGADELLQTERPSVKATWMVGQAGTEASCE